MDSERHFCFISQCQHSKNWASPLSGSKELRGKMHCHWFILRMRVVLSRRVFPGNSAPRMADRDRKLVVRNALTSMGEKGLPRPPEFSVLLVKI